MRNFTSSANFGTNSGKATDVVRINLPKGGPEGNQTIPRGAAPRERANLPDNA